MAPPTPCAWTHTSTGIVALNSEIGIGTGTTFAGLVESHPSQADPPTAHGMIANNMDVITTAKAVGVSTG